MKSKRENESNICPLNGHNIISNNSFVSCHFSKGPTSGYTSIDDGKERRPSGLNTNQWSIHETEVELRRALRRDGMNIYIPTSVTTIVTKYPHEGYGGETQDLIVYEKTTGRYTRGQLSNYEFLLDQFITSKPVRNVDAFPIVGRSKIPELFSAGIENGVLPQPGLLFDQVVESRIFSYSIPNYENNSNKALYHRALVPVKEAFVEGLSDSGDLFPTSTEREYHKLLHEVKDMLQKLKNEDGSRETKKSAAMKLLFEKSELEDEEYKKMLEDMR